MPIKERVETILTVFFNWFSRTFTPRRHAEDLAIKRSISVSKRVLDVRGGEGSRKKIKYIGKELNRRRGSNFIKTSKYG